MAGATTRRPLWPGAAYRRAPRVRAPVAIGIAQAPYPPSNIGALLPQGAVRGRANC
jgi:hypothetical protein